MVSNNLPSPTSSVHADSDKAQTNAPGTSSSASESVELVDLTRKSFNGRDAKESEGKRKSGVSVKVVQVEAGTALESDLLIVDWEENDPENPRNWPRRKKFICTILLSALTFLTPLSSTMIAPAGRIIAEEFNIKDDFIVNMTTSIFVLAYVFNLACGFAQNTSQLIAFRFMSGLGGGAPFSVSGGILGDIWTAEERGTANGLYTVGAVLGTGVGPVCGAWIAEKASWRWVHFRPSFAAYPPILLAKRATKLRVQRGLRKNDMTVIRSKFENPNWT
ncbi:hypothetical protein V5O48_009527 [Marasmius crinis-equi]|uniref:Major facilitator superfamily (MFS) profile domain-containing protein n=1 Tax=Marasmius crinis-equi TaxID=585013 RepID=A0ABR3FAZ7_9AGAR